MVCKVMIWAGIVLNHRLDLSVSAGAKIAVAVVTKTRNDMELFIDLLVHS